MGMDIIVTLKKESFFRFSKWFEIKNLILDYPRETHSRDTKGVKKSDAYNITTTTFIYIAGILILKK